MGRGCSYSFIACPEWSPMRMKLRCGVLLAMVLPIAGCGAQSESKSAAGALRNPVLAPRLGRDAPEIDGEDLGGARFKLSDFRGKVVVLDFWGFWCQHCV